MSPLEQTVLDVLSEAEALTTDEVIWVIQSGKAISNKDLPGAADIVTALEQLRKDGEVTHTMRNSVSLWQRREKLLVDIGAGVR